MFLSSGAGRRYLLRRSDRALAPGRLEVDSFHFSWFGPTRMTGFVLRDAQGQRRLSMRRLALWDRNLWQVLFDPLHRGTLDLQSYGRAPRLAGHPSRGRRQDQSL